MSIHNSQLTCAIGYKAGRPLSRCARAGAGAGARAMEWPQLFRNLIEATGVYAGASHLIIVILDAIQEGRRLDGQRCRGRARRRWGGAER